MLRFDCCGGIGFHESYCQYRFGYPPNVDRLNRWRCCGEQFTKDHRDDCPMIQAEIRKIRLV